MRRMPTESPAVLTVITAVVAGLHAQAAQTVVGGGRGVEAECGKGMQLPLRGTGPELGDAELLRGSDT